MLFVITGASGYIGTRLTSLALKNGHDVLTATRKRSTSFPAWIPFDLSSEAPLILPAETGVVVHLAANTEHANRLSGERELVAAQRLIKSAQQAGAKFIFVSSQTARSDAPTVYGRTKWRIEQDVLSAGGWVVRPGQVYGGDLRGLFGMLVKTVRDFPILPAFAPAPQIQPIHVDDLAEGLLRIAERGDVSRGVYSLAAIDSVSFTKFLDEIAVVRLRRWRGFLPMPIMVINVLAKLLGESWQVRLGFERLRSLFDLPTMETTSDLSKLGLVLRPLHSGMHPSGTDRRRCLLREACALFTYILKAPPTGAVLRRYVRAIELLRGGKALELPKFLLDRPVFLSLIDERVWINKAGMAEFDWRMDAATALAEATPTGAYRFLGLGRKHGLLVSLFSLTASVIKEISWRVARVVSAPLVRFALGRAKVIS